MELHSHIQTQVAKAIEKALQNKYQDLQSLEFGRLWSEVENEKTIRVNFGYQASFSANQPALRTEGWVQLKKINSKTWQLSQINISGEELLFQKPQLIELSPWSIHTNL